jgi:hypothetical protein
VFFMSETSLLASLTAEVRQMRHDINLLLDRSPTTASAWLPPRELARRLGVTSETLTKWRLAGQFRSSSIKPVKRGRRTDWLYHHKDAVTDIERGAN